MVAPIPQGQNSGLFAFGRGDTVKRNDSMKQPVPSHPRQSQRNTAATHANSNSHVKELRRAIADLLA